MANDDVAIPGEVVHLPNSTSISALVTESLSEMDDLTEVRMERDNCHAVDQIVEDQTVGVVLGAGQDNISATVHSIREADTGIPILVYLTAGQSVVPADPIEAGATDVIVGEAQNGMAAIVDTRIKNTIEQYLAEERTARRFRRLVEGSSDIIAVLDASGEIDYVSPAVEAEFGHTPDDLIDANALEYIHPDDRERAAARLHDLAQTPGGDETVEARFDAVDGWRWIEAHGRNLLEDPSVDGIVVHGRDVTDRRRREERLELLEEVVESANDAVYVIDPGGRFTYVNSQFVNLSGYERESLVGADPTDVFPDLPGEEFETAIRSMVNGEQSEYLTEIDITTKDGRSLPVEVSLTSFESDGTFMGTVGVARDVSQRRERADALNELHAATQKFIEASDQDAVAQLTVTTARTVLNQPLSGIWLYDADSEVLQPAATTEEGRTIAGTPPTFSRGEGLVWDAFQRGEIAVYEDLSEEPGKYNPETPISSEIITPIGEFGVLMFGSTEPQAFDEFDVTLTELLSETVEGSLKRTAREEELRTKRCELGRRNERIRALHDVTKRMKSADESAEIHDITIEAAQRILDFDASLIAEAKEELLETVALDESEGDYYETTPLDRDDNLAVEAFNAGETIISDDLHKDGYTPADAKYRSAITVPIGELGVFQAVSAQPNDFDASDRKLAEILIEHTTASLMRLDRELELKKRAAALERQNERLDRFASTVSHDLRNPLNVIRGRVNLLRDSRDEEHIEAVERQLDRMDDLIEELLLLAREDADSENRVKVSIGDVARVVWQDIDSGDVRLELASPPQMLMNQQYLRQLLRNLFENSLEHGGDVTTVTVGGLDGGFYIEDDGTGIPPSEREDVFEFGHSLAGSTGIGLATVAMIAESHELAVEVVEGHDGGARFEFRPADSKTSVSVKQSRSR